MHHGTFFDLFWCPSSALFTARSSISPFIRLHLWWAHFPTVVGCLGDPSSLEWIKPTHAHTYREDRWAPRRPVRRDQYIIPPVTRLHHAASSSILWLFHFSILIDPSLTRSVRTVAGVKHTTIRAPSNLPHCPHLIHSTPLYKSSLTHSNEIHKSQIL